MYSIHLLIYVFSVLSIKCLFKTKSMLWISPGHVFQCTTHSSTVSRCAGTYSCMHYCMGHSSAFKTQQNRSAPSWFGASTCLAVPRQTTMCVKVQACRLFLYGFCPSPIRCTVRQNQSSGPTWLGACSHSSVSVKSVCRQFYRMFEGTVKPVYPLITQRRWLPDIIAI